MKKTKKFLSCLLACLMVLSALPAFASASESDPEPFFCDFEEGFTVDAAKTTRDTEFIKAGFDKGMAPGYDSVSDGNYSNTIIDDEGRLGKHWKSTNSGLMALGVGFDSPVKTGCVKFSFTMKPGKDASDNLDNIPYIRYAQVMGANYNATTKKTMGFCGHKTDPSIYLADASGNRYGNVGTAVADTEHDIEWVVDVTNNTRSLYIDGVRKGIYTHAESNPINSIQGFYFDHSSNQFGKITPAIDNIMLTIYDNDNNMDIVKTIKRDGKIKLVFDEVINDTELTESDISFEEIGGTGTVEASAIKIVGNTMEVSYTEANANAGSKYELVSTALQSVGGKALGQTAIVLRDSAQRFEISNLKFKDNNYTIISPGNTTSTASNGTTSARKYRITADVVNTTGESKKVTLIYAMYNGTTLVDAKTKEITITGDTKTIDQQFTATMDVTFDSYKAFVWDGFDNRVPQVKSYFGSVN